MALTQLAPPYPIFTDKSGDPLDNGYLYFGEVNKNPETNPIQVYYDSAFTQPAAQPLRTSNGYVMRNGSPALIYADSQFSVTIRDKNNALVIYSPVGYGIDPASISGTVAYDDFVGDGSTVLFSLSVSPSTKNATNVYIDGVYQSKDNYEVSGSSLTFSTAPPLNSAIEVVSQESSIIGGAGSQQITYNEGSVGAVTRTVQGRLGDFVSVKDFGAVGDGVADDTGAIQAAINAGKSLFFPDGTYFVESNVTVSVPVWFIGGIVKPDTGVTVTLQKEIHADGQCFDTTNATFTRSLGTGSTAEFTSDGCIAVSGGSVYASWFGCTEASSDVSRPLQVALDSGADEVILDGLYIHTVNFMASNQTVRGLGWSTGLKTRAVTVTFDVSVNDPNHPFAVDDKIYGLTSHSGAETVIVRDMLYDGNAANHYDRSTQYDGIWDGSTLDYNAIKFNNIGFSDMGRGGAYVPPTTVTIDNVKSINAVRNNIGLMKSDTANVSNCYLDSSDVDHLIYADEGTNNNISNIVCRGFARGSMIVTSGSNLTNISFSDFEVNPVNNTTRGVRFHTSRLIDERSDLGFGSKVTNVTVYGDLSNLDTTATDRGIFVVRGKRLTVDTMSVESTAAATEAYSCFIMKEDVDALYIENVKVNDAPSSFVFLDQDGNNSSIKVDGLFIRYDAAATGQAVSLFDLGAGNMKWSQIENVHVVSPTGSRIGAQNLIDMNGGDLDSVIIEAVFVPFAFGNSAQIIGTAGTETISNVVVSNVVTSNAEPAGDVLYTVRYTNYSYNGGRWTFNYIPLSRQTRFESITNDINTSNKALGVMAWDETTGKPLWAAGSAASDVWVDATGTTVYTPV